MTMKKQSNEIKSAVELAMERLAVDQGPLTELTPEQKQQLSEAEAEIEAKIAERKIMYEQRLAEAQATGDVLVMNELSAGYQAEVEALQSELTERKASIRHSVETE